jgi:hypothetical protein
VTSHHHHVLGRGGGLWARGCLRCCKQHRGAASTSPAAPRAPCKGKRSIQPDLQRTAASDTLIRKPERCKPNPPLRHYRMTLLTRTGGRWPLPTNRSPRDPTKPLWVPMKSHIHPQLIYTETRTSHRSTHDVIMYVLHLLSNTPHHPRPPTYTW